MLTIEENISSAMYDYCQIANIQDIVRENMNRCPISYQDPDALYTSFYNLFNWDDKNKQFWEHHDYCYVQYLTTWDEDYTHYPTFNGDFYGSFKFLK